MLCYVSSGQMDGHAPVIASAPNPNEITMTQGAYTCTTGVAR